MRLLKHQARRLSVGLIYVGFVGIVLLIYIGPLGKFTYSNAGLVTRQVLWNYGILVLFIGLLWVFRRVGSRRSVPQLPGTPRQFYVLLGSLVVLLGIVLVLWIKVAPWIELQIHSNHLQSLSLLARKTLLNGIPGVIVTAIMVALSVWQLKGWWRQSFSMSWGSVLLTVALIVLSIILSAVKNHLSAARELVIPTGGIENFILIFAAQFFINGLQEETYFRGYVFPQLLAWMKSPLLAAWVMSILFNAYHIPSLVIGQHWVLSWWQWMLFCMFPIQPTGLLFAAIYYRTRSVLPGALFHTYLSQWAFMFF